MSEKLRVLFVCVGNSCRSQMAEGFARTYGSDVLVPASAGLVPALAVAPDTKRVMQEKNIDLSAHYPKSLDHMGRMDFDLVVNMSGYMLPDTIALPVVEWNVKDPIRASLQVHREVRDQIENLVMELVLSRRRAQKQRLKR